jgi:hypothetical protein
MTVYYTEYIAYQIYSNNNGWLCRSPTTDFLRKLSSLHSDGTAVPCVPVTRQHSWSTEHGTGPSVSSSLCPMNSGRKDRPGGSWLPPSLGRKDKPQWSSQNANNSPNDRPRVMRDLVRLGEFQNDRSLRKVITYLLLIFLSNFWSLRNIIFIVMRLCSCRV